MNGAGAVWDYTDGFAYRKDGTGANDPAYSSSSFVPAYWHFMPNALGGATPSKPTPMPPPPTATASPSCPIRA